MLNLNFENRSGNLVIQIRDTELGADCSTELKDAILEKLDETPWAVLDLSTVEFMDSSALGVMVAALKAVRGRGELQVVGVQPRIEELFRLTGLDRIFSFEPEIETALESLTNARTRSKSA